MADRLKRLLLLWIWILCLSDSTLSFNYDPLVVEANSTITFFENDTKMLVRTPDAYINSTMCLEYRIQIEGKRTRVRVYGCRLSEGGLCTFDGFRGGTSSIEDVHCHSVGAWMYRPDSYGFYFAFERRPRRFRDRADRRRYLRRLRKRRANPKAIVTLGGIKQCEDVCKDTDGL